MLRYLRRDARPFDAASAAALRPYQGLLAALLHARGVNTAAEAEAFLHPSPDSLHDPLQLHDMDKALSLFAQAKAEGWPAVVYGDYDADGVCACSLMTEALRAYGVDAAPHVPLRAEGYGLNLTAVEALAPQAKLLVTVDLGMTNAAEVARAQELGMRVIVTDHHQPGLIPCPADAVLNPLLGDYPFPRLCGTGVAFKVAQALLGEEAAAQWLDLAALATVADIVPLTGENRVLVACGLPRIGERPGLKSLLEVAGATQPLQAETVAFQLAPRINAGGRVADAKLGVRLLLTRDAAEAEELARALDAANAERKRLEAQAVEEAAPQVDAHDFVTRRVLFVRGRDWHTGVVGLVAGKLNHRLGVPVCALSETEDGLLHGSLRGVRGVNLARCLQACDDLLLRYGGHELAAGVTLAAENDEAFRERLEHAVGISAPEEAFVPAQEYDLPLDFGEVGDTLMDALELLQPFGFGNPAPVFYSGAAKLERRRACGAQGAHLQLTLRQRDRLLAGIAFGMGELAATLPDTVDAAFTLARETYLGKTSVKCHVEALTPSLSTRAEALSTLPDAHFESALLRGLLDVQALSLREEAGNPAPDAELIKAVAIAAPPVREGQAPAKGGSGDNPLQSSDAPQMSGLSEPINSPRQAEPSEPNYTPRQAKPSEPSYTPQQAAPSEPISPPRQAETSEPNYTTRQAEPSEPISQTEPQELDAMLQGRQGTLLVAYTRDSAQAALARFGEKLDVATGAPRDPRCFHTLLLRPEPLAVRGRWRQVVLLDGALAGGDVPRWQAALPGARVLALPITGALRAAAAAVDAGDARYRELFRLLRRSAFGSVRQAAQAAQLSETQTLVGLYAFAALGLIDFGEAPFHYYLCEPRKCSLSDSPVLGALRALSARMEAREC